MANDKLSDYDYAFPADLIAQRSAGKGKTRILHCPKDGGPRKILSAQDIPDLLRPNDCLVVNNTKVIPARIIAKRPTGGKVEILLVRPIHHNDLMSGTSIWEAMVKPGRAFGKGAVLQLLGNSNIRVEVDQVLATGNRLLRFDTNAKGLTNYLKENGHVPLPPYIDREDDAEDRAMYQTIFAKHEGAVAAPTASLHFDDEILGKIKAKGVRVAEVTLHVGPGTFQNISSDEYRSHALHEEWYCIDQEAVQTIQACRQAGGRVISVGTTATRVLETVAAEDGSLQAGQGWTSIFLYPGYTFKVIDGLLTNFHWPKSSLVLLVAAFYGKDPTLAAYSEAVAHRMRLFSYGDGMLIL